MLYSWNYCIWKDRINVFFFFLLIRINTAPRKRKNVTIWSRLPHCTAGILHFFSLHLLPNRTHFFSCKIIMTSCVHVDFVMKEVREHQ